MLVPPQRVTKLRGKHERQGRHEGSRPSLVIEFAEHISDLEKEAFIREWERRYVPSGSVSFEQPRKSFLEAFWEAYRR